jgi:hypothetical protein
MTIASDPEADSVPSIDLLELTDLATWAHSEMGEWVGERCKECDIAAIGYGLGRYWDICVKRAKCWIQCRKQFPNLVTSTDAANTDAEELQIAATKLSKREMLPYLGRSTITLQSADAIIRIFWKLQFDWTGDVESVVTAEAALPQSWHESDATDALRKIPVTFDALMRERGVMKAVEVIAGLVFDV